MPKKPSGRPNGRPSAWPDDLQPTDKCANRLPVIFKDFLEDEYYKQKLIKLLRQFKKNGGNETKNE